MILSTFAQVLKLFYVYLTGCWVRILIPHVLGIQFIIVYLLLNKVFVFVVGVKTKVASSLLLIISFAVKFVSNKIFVG